MVKFDYGKVKDPLIFAENRVEAHSDHICYASLEELKEQKSSFRHSLDGLWKFSYSRNYLPSGDLRRQSMTANPGRISECPRISRWKGMMRLSMRIHNIPGTEEKILKLVRFQNFSIRWRVMSNIFMFQSR